MTRVKICGITNLEDAQAAVEYGADMLGFVLVPESPRFFGDPVGIGRYRIGGDVPEQVRCIAVCRDAADVDFDARWTGFVDAFQVYGDSRTSGNGGPWIPVFRFKDEASLSEIGRSRLDSQVILLDSSHADKLGGTGISFDWELASEAKRRYDKKVILAGGLNPDNVEDALSAVRPWAVDVSSGVEAEPGIKDHKKLRMFIKSVRRFDEQHGKQDHVR